MNNLLEMENVKVTQGPASFFPVTTVSQNKRIRKGSIEMHFRRQIKASDYSTRKRLYEKHLEVRC